MLVEFSVKADRILDARYQTYGCPTARACGALACKLLSGRTLEQAASIAGEDLVLILHGVPEGKEHCPRMTFEAIQQAIGSPIREHL